METAKKKGQTLYFYDSIYEFHLLTLLSDSLKFKNKKHFQNYLKIKMCFLEIENYLFISASSL